jgi:hypothetical protein
MKTTRRVRTTALVALVVAIAGVVEAHGSGTTASVGVAVGFGSGWVADLDSRQIVRINPRTERIVGRLRLRGLPVRLAVGFGSPWVRDDGGRVLRIKPQQ